MALQKTRLQDIIKITGVANQAVGLGTGGVSPTPVGIASTCYVKSVVMHNPTSFASTISLYYEAATSPASNPPAEADQFYHQTLAANETQILELNYPLVFTHNDTLSAVVGIASTANIMVLGDIERTV